VERKEMSINSRNNYNYNKNLQPLANQLRKNFTKAEACLWKYALKAKQLRGYQFRRQRPVLHYIADFLCKELMLIVEVDGVTHDDEQTFTKDKAREENLTKAGFKVVRFTDDEILKNMTGVISTLERLIDEMENSTPSIPRQRGTKIGLAIQRGTRK
jgi:very-short-patch-repair endonuclease